jgi:hypothetical protein
VISVADSAISLLCWGKKYFYYLSLLFSHYIMLKRGNIEMTGLGFKPIPVMKGFHFLCTDSQLSVRP